jgi:tetratricopeptide (TPR) repeat protein
MAGLCLCALTPLRLYALQGDLNPRETANRYEAILAGDSLHAEANWRAAVALVDIGKQTPDNQKSRIRDSLYRQAVAYARRAVRVAPEDASTHFALALSLGKVSVTLGGRDRVRNAKEVREAALRAIELNPGHDGAWHVLGRWHAEIERLSNIEEFFAKTLLGGKVLGEASWEEAFRCMRKAVELRPDYIFHRLDLAEMLLEVKRPAEARAELEAIRDLPILDAMDPTHKLRAAELLRKI